MQEHPAALDADCMERTGRTLHEYVDMGWRGMSSLAHLARYLGPCSHTWRELHPEDELCDWGTASTTNGILADIYDALAHANANVVAGFSRKRARKPKPYPRPNASRSEVVGRDAIPVREFESWWKSG